MPRCATLCHAASYTPVLCPTAALRAAGAHCCNCTRCTCPSDPRCVCHVRAGTSRVSCPARRGPGLRPPPSRLAACPACWRRLPATLPLALPAARSAQAAGALPDVPHCPGWRGPGDQPVRHGRQLPACCGMCPGLLRGCGWPSSWPSCHGALPPLPQLPTGGKLPQPHRQLVHILDSVRLLKGGACSDLWWQSLLLRVRTCLRARVRPTPSRQPL